MKNEQELEVADFSRRVSAFAVDIVLFVALFLLALKILFPGELLSTHSKGMPMAWIFIALFLLYQAFFSSEGRASLGKHLLGIKVVDCDGNALSVPAAAVRSLAYLLSGMFSLGFIWGLFSKNRQTWHDLLTGSVVVSVHPPSPAFRRAALAGAWCAVLALGVIYTWQIALAAPYYRGKTLASAQSGLEELGRLEQIHKELHGSYTTSIVGLANISGEPHRFIKNMTGLFDAAEGIDIQVTGNSFLISAQARDRKHTPLRLAGPEKI